jgi:hypothetical protein
MASKVFAALALRDIQIASFVGLLLFILNNFSATCLNCVNGVCIGRGFCRCEAGFVGIVA